MSKRWVIETNRYLSDDLSDGATDDRTLAYALLNGYLNRGRKLPSTEFLEGADEREARKALARRLLAIADALPVYKSPPFDPVAHNRWLQRRQDGLEPDEPVPDSPLLDRSLLTVLAQLLDPNTAARAPRPVQRHLRFAQGRRRRTDHTRNMLVSWNVSDLAYYHKCSVTAAIETVAEVRGMTMYAVREIWDREKGIENLWIRIAWEIAGMIRYEQYSETAAIEAVARDRGMSKAAVRKIMDWHLTEAGRA